MNKSLKFFKKPCFASVIYQIYIKYKWKADQFLLILPTECAFCLGATYLEYDTLITCLLYFFLQMHVNGLSGYKIPFKL